jgi:hypothetical protein
MQFIINILLILGLFQTCCSEKPILIPSNRLDNANSADFTFAYAFYATSDLYACSVLVIIDKLISLRQEHTAMEIDIVVIYLANSLSSPTLTSFHELPVSYRVKLRAVEPIHFRNNNGYYNDCMVKMYVFSLTEYSRVVYMDADGLPLHNLDHLFHLVPSVPFAAPRAWWLAVNRNDQHYGNNGFFTSAFMALEPSTAKFDAIIEELRKSSSNLSQFDMDLLNTWFGISAMVLPNEYICLNGLWEGGSDHYENFFIAKDLQDLIRHCMYLHYTSVQKPWALSMKDVRGARPMADPIFFEQWEEWKNRARTICPSTNNGGVRFD